MGALVRGVLRGDGKTQADIDYLVTTAFVIVIESVRHEVSIVFLFGWFPP